MNNKIEYNISYLSDIESDTDDELNPVVISKKKYITSSKKNITSETEQTSTYHNSTEQTSTNYNSTEQTSTNRISTEQTTIISDTDSTSLSSLSPSTEQTPVTPDIDNTSVSSLSSSTEQYQLYTDINTHNILLNHYNQQRQYNPIILNKHHYMNDKLTPVITSKSTLKSPPEPIIPNNHHYMNDKSTPVITSKSASKSNTHIIKNGIELYNQIHTIFKNIVDVVNGIFDDNIQLDMTEIKWDDNDIHALNSMDTVNLSELAKNINHIITTYYNSLDDMVNQLNNL
jgi:hypothetical protein